MNFSIPLCQWGRHAYVGASHFLFMRQFIFLLTLLALAACAPIRIPLAATPTRAIASTSIAPTNAPPSANATREPTARPSQTPTGTMKIKVFFVALDDKGKSGKAIGCADSIVAVERLIPITTAPLTAALRELFSLRDAQIGQSGLYNALAQSPLKIESVSIIGERAEIQLSGTLKLGGVCDNPRVDAQIKETALQFSNIKSVSVSINGTPLEKILSEK
ncbi:MAG: GerMN domain-containing protein [Chloroflexi bacterium]|nr:GerMN domain-containing protein [Chloroflexota bacterium]